MSFTDLVKSVADLISEVNKAEDNAQQKKFLSTLRRIERQIKRQENNAKKHLIIGISVLHWFCCCRFVTRKILLELVFS